MRPADPGCRLDRLQCSRVEELAPARPETDVLEVVRPRRPRGPPPPRARARRGGSDREGDDQRGREAAPLRRRDRAGRSAPSAAGKRAAEEAIARALRPDRRIRSPRGPREDRPGRLAGSPAARPAPERARPRPCSATTTVASMPKPTSTAQNIVPKYRRGDWRAGSRTRRPRARRAAPRARPSAGRRARPGVGRAPTARMIPISPVCSATSVVIVFETRTSAESSASRVITASRSANACVSALPGQSPARAARAGR